MRMQGVKYWAIIFHDGSNVPVKLRMVSSGFRSLYYWLERRGYHWTSINVYYRQPAGGRGGFVVQLRPVSYWQKIREL